MSVADALARHGASQFALERLARYGELLLEANRRVNLTAARTADAIAEQIADAFVLAPLIRGSLVDVGAGGGLPGIPLAILCGVSVTLIDATAKKVAFLRDALNALQLEGEAVTGRAETLGRDPRFRGQFAHATARAVGSAPTVLELTLPFVAEGGSALLQRGRID
ncbi:MAG: 16S rRNA (guanine(527)-N(7))-methyltransferase RsmG, partial [Vulcanimicrobiaceae bacterium]